MDLLERYGFKVSIMFILLSMAVAGMKNNETTEVNVTTIKDLIPEIVTQNTSLPQDIPLSKCPMAVAGMKSSETTEVNVTSIKDIFPEIVSQNISMPQDIPLSKCPCDECQKEQRPARRLGPEESSVPQEKKDTIMKALRLTGGVLSLSILLLPFIGFWTTGSLPNTLQLYSELDLGCAALASYGWLLFSVLQASFKEQEEIIGIDAIVLNAFSWGFIAFMLVFVLLAEWEAKGVVCCLGLVGHIILTIGVLHLPIFKWVRKDSREKLIIGVIAGIFQNIAELIPMCKLVERWLSNAPEGGYPLVPNYKKFTV
ncbi:hypothetical protein ACQJBY_044706 [Aegilops geniculata]